MSTPLIVIVGPTASGKTAFAIELAKRIGGEIICADSRTVYKYMDVGSAKPAAKERTQVRHYLLDIIEPNQQFSAARFKNLAVSAIKDITKKGKIPIVVGGTGLYVDSILFDYTFGQKADESQRIQLNAKTTEELLDICRQKDIEIPYNSTNRRHLIRAIELGGLQKAHKKKLRPRTLIVGISISKEELLENVTKRTENMVKEGVLDETQRLVDRFGWNHESMTGSAYRIFKMVLEEKISIQGAVEACIRRDMQLAKRQMTWFKRNTFIKWDSPPQLMELVEHFLSHQK